VAKIFDQGADDPRPSGLMARTDAGAVVAVEIFVKQQVIAPIGIALEFFHAAKHRPSAAVSAMVFTVEVGQLRAWQSFCQRRAEL
jgi:hypothetical protein